MRCPKCNTEIITEYRRDPLDDFLDLLKIIFIGFGGFIVIQGLIKLFA